ncbi:Protein of unknown function (DUF3021) [Ruminococcaceae bacterium R-25]|nr:Protein of unknown function (DUF3021) [Ruminococcaceae bacterium R-25]SUQ21648.1 Protein of unknown function [Oscillospiraceae bacterium]
MKKILRDTCILSALTVLAVFTVSIIWIGVTAEIKLVLELFALSFIISVVNFLLDEITSLPIWGSYILKFVVVTAIVMLFGFIAGWFFASNFWMAFIYVGIVFIAAYLLDAIKIKKDIEFINSRIKERT